MTVATLLRFDETDAALRPRDAVGKLGDLDVAGALAMPPVVDAATGRGRAFSTGFGLVASDVVPGSTLVTRNATIQTILRWDPVAQSVTGLGTIYARGRGTSAAEYIGAGLELRTVNVPLRVGELRWLWHTTAGVLKTQIGGHLKIPTDAAGNPSGFLLLTATRRWVSKTSVVLRYYVGDVMIAEVPSVDGDIGGGTTGTTQIGTRWTGIAYSNPLQGVIDELRVLDRELAPEEVQATWKRISELQPLGYQLIDDSHPPGFPMSRDPGSRLQRESRLWGHALGFAAAQAENVRANIMPDRAYGPVLEQWERITKSVSRSLDDEDTRRARVLGKIRARAGVSVPGVGAALGELLDSAPSLWTFLAFDNTVVDGFAALEASRWLYSAGWSINGAALRVQAAAAADIRLAGAAAFAAYRNWLTCLAAADGDGRYHEALVKIVPTTIPPSSEVGIVRWAVGADGGKDRALLFGIRNNAGTYQVISERMRDGELSGVTVHAATSLTTHWLHLYARQDAGELTDHVGAVSTTSGTSGFAAYTIADHPSSHQWVGFYARSTIASLASGLDVKFDDAQLRAPRGTRPFKFYVVRSPGLPGSPDFVGANLALRALRHAFTHAAAIPDAVLNCDTSGEGCDLTPMGGI